MTEPASTREPHTHTAQSPRGESDSPVDREKAWHAFKTALDRKFRDHPDKVKTTQSGVKILALGSSDPNIRSIDLTRQTPGQKPGYLIIGDSLDIRYSNGDRVVYDYTPDAEVVRWKMDKEKEGAMPEIPDLPKEDLGIAEKLRALQEMDLRVTESIRYLKEHKANLKLEQQMGTNGQPASTPDTNAATAIVTNGKVI